MIERAEEEAKAKEEADDDDDDDDVESGDENQGETDELTVPWIAKFFTNVFDIEKAPFRVESDTNEDLLLALGEKIAQEIQSVQGYVSTWRASGVMGAVPAKNVEADTCEHVKS